LKGIAAEELGRFIALLARLDTKGKNPFERLQESLSAQDFPHVVLKKEFRAERPGERENRAARMYFTGISHAKELFEKQRDVLKFNVTTRWIQTIFDYILVDESFIYGLTNIKNYDEYTLNHSVNVAILSLGLGRRLGLSRSELVELGVSAFLHDLGKLDIPYEILEKPSQLSREERTIMDRHSHRGAERIIELRAKHGIPNRAVQVAFEHHLKADLGEYPKFGRKKRLNLYSKIVKITDYFDALTTKRVYRPKAFTPEEALKVMIHERSGEFDPVLLKAFAAMVGAYPVGSLVALDTGEIGIVFELSSHRGLAQRPKIKLITDPQGKKIDGPIIDLAEIDAATRSFKRTIVKSLDPEKYGIPVSDYFLAQASAQS
jgi:HD-GYP domain-containing protein (c-di-GMP phosphodiesterase class II)